MTAPAYNFVQLPNYKLCQTSRINHVFGRIATFHDYDVCPRPTIVRSFQVKLPLEIICEDELVTLCALACGDCFARDVDRTGLIDGVYSGWVGLDGSDGSTVWISVAMQMGEKVAGEAGYQYALLLDDWTFGADPENDGTDILDIRALIGTKGVPRKK